MEVSGLALVAVLLIRPVGALLLVVAALRGWVAGQSVQVARKLPGLAYRTALLIAACWTVPVAITALVLEEAPLVVSTRALTRKTVTFDLQRHSTNMRRDKSDPKGEN